MSAFAGALVVGQVRSGGKMTLGELNRDLYLDLLKGALSTPLTTLTG